MIDPMEAMQVAYWYGAIDTLRDTYRMVFKDIEGSDKLNETLSVALDNILKLANIDHKNLHFLLKECLPNDLHSIKQTMWSEVLLKLPDFGKVIVTSQSKDPKFKKDMNNLMKMAEELQQTGQLDKAMSSARSRMNRRNQK
jgi:hypothetical protein